MKYEDLSAYSHSPAYVVPNLVNFGWLGDQLRSSSTGGSDRRLSDPLRQYLSYVVARTRGIHLCAFCAPPREDRRDGAIPGMLERPLAQEVEGHLLGSAEIRIPGEGTVYAAPDLVVHYVAKHGYQPPPEVVKAILSGPRPGSVAYFNAVAPCLLPEDFARWGVRL